MFDTEDEMQAFDEYRAMMEREFGLQTRFAAQEMVKEGGRRGHWPMVAAGYESLAGLGISANETAVYVANAKRYRRMTSAAELAEQRVELATRAQRRMGA